MGVLPWHLLDRAVLKGMHKWRKCQAKHPSVALAILMACFPCRAVEDDVLSGIVRLYHATAPYMRMPYSRGKDGADEGLVSKSAMRSLASMIGMRCVCISVRDRSMLCLVGAALERCRVMGYESRVSAGLATRLLRDTMGSRVPLDRLAGI